MLQFLIPHVRYLQENGFKVEIACSEVGGRFQEVVDTVPEDTIVHRVHLFRSPVKLGNIKGYFELKEILKKGRYDIVWTNEPVMGVMTRLAAKKLKKYGLKVIYTAHGFHFYKGAPLKNWLFFYPIERICSRWTDVLITINKEDYNRAKKEFLAKKVVYISGVGVDTKKFLLEDFDRTKKRKELGIIDEYMIFSAGELNTNKNHEVIIKALSILNNRNIHYFIAGKGDKEQYLTELAQKLGVNLHLLGYRTDIVELLNSADLYVFPSYREGLSVALMEAMVAGLPCVVSKIRGNVDLIEDGKGGFLVEPDDVAGFAKKINFVAINNCKEMSCFNREKIRLFDVCNVLDRMRIFYLDEFGEEIL